MEMPQGQPRAASFPSQHMDVAFMSTVDDVSRAATGNYLATSVATDSKATIGAGQTEASNTETVAMVPSDLTLVPSDIGQPCSLIMTEAEAEKAVLEMPDEKPFIRDYSRWACKEDCIEALDRYLKFDQSLAFPSRIGEPTPEELRRRHNACASLEMWPVWVSEVKDDATRSRLNEWLKRMQKIGLDPQVYAKPVAQQPGLGGPGKKGSRREKNDDTLLFDDMIETSTFVVSKTCKINIKITKKEFQATGVSIDAVNLRIAIAGGHTDGNKIYEDYIQTREEGGISINDWKNCTAVTSANPQGRDLFVYALHEAQLAKGEIKELQRYLQQHKATTQKKNTIGRIADCSARINHWLALAVELDKVRPLVETDTEENEELESETAIVSSLAQQVSDDEHVTMMSSNSGQNNESNTHVKTLQGNPKLKVPYDSVQDPRPVMTKTPTIQRVRLRPPKPPIEADGRNKQEIHGMQQQQATRQPKRKVVAISDDSDSEFQMEEEVKTQTAKRMKTNGEASTESPGQQLQATPPKQISGNSAPPQSSSSNVAYSIRELSETDQQKRQTYLLKHFLPELNLVLKAKGLAHVRVVPREWEVIKRKLVEAGVPAKQRNEFLRLFKFGWTQAPNLGGSTAAEANYTHDSSSVSPSAAITSTDTAPNDQLIVTLRVYPGFNPADYSPSAIIELPGYRYRFHPLTTIYERIYWASSIARDVAATLRGEVFDPDAEWYRRFGQHKRVLNEQGKIIADGYWDEVFGQVARGSDWLWEADPWDY